MIRTNPASIVFDEYDHANINRLCSAFVRQLWSVIANVVLTMVFTNLQKF